MLTSLHHLLQLRSELIHLNAVTLTSLRILPSLHDHLLLHKYELESFEVVELVDVFSHLLSFPQRLLLKLDVIKLLFDVSHLLLFVFAIFCDALHLLATIVFLSFPALLLSLSFVQHFFFLVPQLLSFAFLAQLTLLPSNPLISF